MGPISIARDRSLKELLNFVEPNYQIPSTTHISTLIRKKFHDGIVLPKKRIHGLTSITQAFATTKAHFIDDNWVLVSYVLETVHFPGRHTGIRISQTEKSLLSYRMQTDQISCLVHDEAVNAVLAGKFHLFMSNSFINHEKIRLVDFKYIFTR